MTLSNSLKKAAYALPLVFMIAANANAAPSTTVELDTLDLSKPIPTNICFESNAKGTAFDKLKTAMNARNQIVVATANQAVVEKNGNSPYAGRIVSSTINGNEGYYTGLEVPKEDIANSPSACLTAIKNINIYDVNKLTAVPAEVNKGEMGVALRNAHTKGTKVMMTAQSTGGALLALQYNSTQGYGGLISADANGNKAGTLGNMASIGYSTAYYR